MFALLSLGVFIFFIHHVAMSIQGNEIVARVAAELIDGVERMAVGKAGGPAGGDGRHEATSGREHPREGQPWRVSSHTDGYLQIIDSDALLALAVRTGSVLEVVCRPGRYAICGTPLVLVWPARAADDALAAEVRGAFAFGNQRTSAQDLEFPLDQLVEVAVRALSTGVNDPFTAVT